MGKDQGDFFDPFQNAYSEKDFDTVYENAHQEQVDKIGPPLFGLYPNGLYPNGLSLNGLQGQLDYPQLDYL